MPLQPFAPDSVQNVKDLILAASLPGWGEPGGLAQMIYQTLLIAGSRGMAQAANLAQLAQVRGSETSLVLVSGKAIYGFNPSAAGTIPSGNVLAAGGGQWQFLCAAPPAPYTRLFGDGVSTSFVLPHNQDSDYPNVEVWDVPTGKRLQRSAYDVTVTANNSITITQAGGPAWAGNAVRVIIKAY